MTRSDPRFPTYRAARTAAKAARLWLLVSVSAWLLPVCAEAQVSPVELAVKATYLYKLPPFIDWPPAAALAGQFLICIVGEDPFGGLLDRAVSGQLAKDRPIAVRRMASFSGDLGCQIVYVTGSSAQSIAAILAAARGKPILSVTDGQREGQPMGILNFVIADSRVRFEIDQRAATEAGLVISSKLLSLALHVRS